MTKVFILVGTSPLPCYVSAIDLKNYFGENSKFYLVCSEKKDEINQESTIAVGKRIKDNLLKLSMFEQDSIKILPIKNVSSRNDIETALGSEFNNGDELHLNYTGGTKTMSALAYYTIEMQNKKASFSYLDSRTNVMIYDDPDDTIENDSIDLSGFSLLSNDYEQKDLRSLSMLSTDISTLANLHDMPEPDLDKNKKDFQSIKEKMIELFENDKLDKVYEKQNLYDKIRKYHDIDKYIEDFGVEKRRVIAERKCLFQEEFEGASSKKTKEIHKYIDGEWLEDYIYDRLYEYLNNSNTSIRLHLDVEKSNGYQLDIVAVYGYQATVISATTDSTKGLCKQKAFEAIHRARQLGGEEAKSILVSFANGDCIRELNNDMETIYGSISAKFKAFGIEDLKKDNFCEEVIKHIMA